MQGRRKFSQPQSLNRQYNAALHGWEGTVKFTRIAICLVVLSGLSSMAQSSRPVPTGMREAENLEEANEKGFPPMLKPSRSIDPAALRNEADQLADIAASLPQSVDKASHGVLEKDLISKLKQIEKLSKHLRNQLNH